MSSCIDKMHDKPSKNSISRFDTHSSDPIAQCILSGLCCTGSGTTRVQVLSALSGRSTPEHSPLSSTRTQCTRNTGV